MPEIDPSVFSPYENELLRAEPLREYAFSLCGGPCSGLFRVKDRSMLATLAERCISYNLPFRVFGGLTNVLVSDDGYDGVVLLNRAGTVSHEEDDDGTVLLKADAGAGMAAVVRYCAEHEISGFEWAAGLPGTVGGAVYGNAGAFGSDISRCCRTVSVIDADGRRRNLSNGDMDFAYRSSLLKRSAGNSVVLHCEFLLKKGNKADILAKAEEYRTIRKNAQPVSEHSLGSVFKNPENESAGKLIQAAGLKGFSIGKATVSMKHANFITTEKGVTAADYHHLVQHVQNCVLDRFGICLEPEIEMLGFES